jgi:predicted alpha/beta-hydrolase family hydrolase
VPSPQLAILGGRDPLCEASALRAALPEGARVVVIEGADHGLEDVESMGRTELNLRRAAEEVAAWAAKLVSGPPPSAPSADADP